jgi:hypothetical protein
MERDFSVNSTIPLNELTIADLARDIVDTSGYSPGYVWGALLPWGLRYPDFPQHWAEERIMGLYQSVIQPSFTLRDFVRAAYASAPMIHFDIRDLIQGLVGEGGTTTPEGENDWYGAASRVGQVLTYTMYGLAGRMGMDRFSVSASGTQNELRITIVNDEIEILLYEVLKLEGLILHQVASKAAESIAVGNYYSFLAAQLALADLGGNLTLNFSEGVKVTFHLPTIIEANIRHLKNNCLPLQRKWNIFEHFFEEILNGYEEAVGNWEKEWHSMQTCIREWACTSKGLIQKDREAVETFSSIIQHGLEHHQTLSRWLREFKTYFLYSEEEKELNLRDEILWTVSSLPETTEPKIALQLDDVRVVGQSHRLRYILNCLITNAIEAAHRTAGEVRVVLQHKDAQAVIVISDTGPGINKDALEYLTFGDSSYVQVFYKGRNLSPEQQNPPGMFKSFGLILSQAITEHIGGTFEFLSEERQGTTVTVTLPCE